MAHPQAFFTPTDVEFARYVLCETATVKGAAQARALVSFTAKLDGMLQLLAEESAERAEHAEDLRLEAELAELGVDVDAEPCDESDEAPASPPAPEEEPAVAAA